jgi:hypothetical protein
MPTCVFAKSSPYCICSFVNSVNAAVLGSKQARKEAGAGAEVEAVTSSDVDAAEEAGPGGLDSGAEHI